MLRCSRAVLPFLSAKWRFGQQRHAATGQSPGVVLSHVAHEGRTVAQVLQGEQLLLESGGRARAHVLVRYEPAGQLVDERFTRLALTVLDLDPSGGGHKSLRAEMGRSLRPDRGVRPSGNVWRLGCGARSRQGQPLRVSSTALLGSAGACTQNNEVWVVYPDRVVRCYLLQLLTRDASL